MFKYLSLKYKILILIFGSFLSFAVLVGLVFIGEKEIAEQSVERLHDLIQGEVEQKLKLSTDSVAQSLGALIKGLDEKQQIAVIAKAIEDFRFEDDKSGYYFVYKEYVPVAHPTRKDLLGKSLAEAKDVNACIMCGSCLIPQNDRQIKDFLCIIFFLSLCLMAHLAMLLRLPMRL